MKSQKIFLRAFLLLLTGGGLGSAALGAEPAPACARHEIPVSLGPSLPSNRTLVGWMCTPEAGASDAVQVLVPGFTYNHTYWDFGYQPENYSYMRAAVAAGHTVFMIDRLGTGESSKPPALSVTVPLHAWNLHQVVQVLRSGATGQSFETVVTVGHSLGAAAAQLEASQYQDVDGVVLSSWLHLPNPIGPVLVVGGTLIPAQLVPGLADRPLGYLTTLAVARARFHAPGTDPAVIAEDLATRDTGTNMEELTILPPTLDPSVTQAITAPVLLAVGERDVIFCGVPNLLTPCDDAPTVLQREAPNFGPQFDVFVLPEAGHDINLAPNASDWFAAANAWIALIGN